MVENYLKEYGYKKTEIDKILNNKNIKNINIKKVKEINKFLEDMNIPKDKIIIKQDYNNHDRYIYVISIKNQN